MKEIDFLIAEERAKLQNEIDIKVREFWLNIFYIAFISLAIFTLIWLLNGCSGKISSPAEDGTIDTFSIERLLIILCLFLLIGIIWQKFKLHEFKKYSDNLPKFDYSQIIGYSGIRWKKKDYRYLCVPCANISTVSKHINFASHALLKYEYKKKKESDSSEKIVCSNCGRIIGWWD